MWEDVEGQENFPVSAGFELTAQIQIYHAKEIYIKKKKEKKEEIMLKQKHPDISCFCLSILSFFFPKKNKNNKQNKL